MDINAQLVIICLQMYALQSVEMARELEQRFVMTGILHQEMGAILGVTQLKQDLHVLEEAHPLKIPVQIYVVMV